MRLIDATNAIESIDEIVCSMSVCINSDYCNGMRAMKDMALHAIEKQPTVDAVPAKVIEQFKWERDTAIQQLEEHGIPFCGKADVAPIVRCKDCKKRGTDNCEREYYLYGGRSNNWYCASGERGEE